MSGEADNHLSWFSESSTCSREGDGWLVPQAEAHVPRTAELSPNRGFEPTL